MAKTTVVSITDDLDGSEGAREIAFSFDGVDYSIDLSESNVAAMTDALGPYLRAATKKSVGRRPVRARTGPTDRRTREDYRAIREWARGQGIEVSDRGRVPAAVVEQYEAAR